MPLWLLLGLTAGTGYAIGRNTKKNKEDKKGGKKKKGGKNKTKRRKGKK